MHELASVVTPAVEDSFVETLPTMIYDVVRHRGHWKVLHMGKHSAPHPSQKAAIDSAMKLAMQNQTSGRSVAVRLNRTDGRIFDLTAGDQRP
jgi:DUF1365 family protein